MRKRTVIASLLASTLSSLAMANASYTVATPSPAPYQRFENSVAPGAFTDTFDFTLTQASSGYIWLFARQDAWFGFDAVENTKNIKLTLVNNSTETQQFGVLYPQARETVPFYAPGFLSLAVSGFDPNRSLFIDGDFAPGRYTALIEGIATGSAGSSYIAKFALTPTVPENSTSLLMALGLAGVVLSTRRLKASASA